jgi:hypothetical protein
VRCYVEPSPAGGYFVRLRGEAAPLSRHDTEEEAEAAAAAYDRGLQRQDAGEFVQLDDGAEVLLRIGDEAVTAVDPGSGAEVGVARYERDPERPHVATATVTIEPAWRRRGLDAKLLRRLRELAAEHRIRSLE